MCCKLNSYSVCLPFISQFKMSKFISENKNLWDIFIYKCKFAQQCQYKQYIEEDIKTMYLSVPGYNIVHVSVPSGQKGELYRPITKTKLTTAHTIVLFPPTNYKSVFLLSIIYYLTFRIWNKNEGFALSSLHVASNTELTILVIFHHCNNPI